MATSERHPAAAALVAALTVTAALAMAGLGSGWARLASCLLAAGVVVLGTSAAFALFRGSIRARLAITGALVAATSVLTGARALGVVLLPSDVWPSRAYAAVLFLATVVGAIGLVRRVPWTRWLVLALGGGGLGTGCLNLFEWMRALLAFDVGRGAPSDHLWLLSGAFTCVLLTFGAFLMIVLLGGRAMRDAFGRPFTIDQPETVWQARDSLVSAVKGTLTAQFVAAAMSVLYALGQPAVPSTRTSALVIAATFVVAAALTIARRTAGILLLLATGLGFGCQAIATLWLARHAPDVDAPGTARFYGVFWGAAAGLSLVCAAIFVRRFFVRSERIE